MGMSMLTEHPCPAVCWSFEPGSKVPSTLGQGVHLCLRAEPCLQGNSVQVTFESYVFLFEKGSQVALAGLELVLRIHSVSLCRALDGTHSCFVECSAHILQTRLQTVCLVQRVHATTCMWCQRSLSYHVDSAVHTRGGSVARAFRCRALTTAY